MLLKNDERYELTMQDKQVVKEKFRKFPVRLTYPGDRVKKSLAKHNTLPDKPNQIAFPLVEIVKTKNGTDTWRYCDSRIIDQKGVVKYNPHNFSFTGTRIFADVDIEMIWFLYTKSHFVEGGTNFDVKKVPKAVFEDLIGSAETKALMEERKAEIKALIYSNKIGLGEDRLRQIAKAYFINDVDDLTLAQVRIALETEINRDKNNGITKFEEMSQGTDVLIIKGAIQNAIDRNLIKYMLNKRSWVWITENGRKNIPIVQVIPTVNPNEAIYEYYMADRQFAQTLLSTLKGQPFVSSEGGGSPDGAGGEGEE